MAILDTNENHAENTRNKCDKIYEIKSFSCDIKIYVPASRNGAYVNCTLFLKVELNLWCMSDMNICSIFVQIIFQDELCRGTYSIQFSVSFSQNIKLNHI